jgi:hypothetical protein
VPLCFKLTIWLHLHNQVKVLFILCVCVCVCEFVYLCVYALCFHNRQQNPYWACLAPVIDSMSSTNRWPGIKENFDVQLGLRHKMDLGSLRCLEFARGSQTRTQFIMIYYEHWSDYETKSAEWPYTLQVCWKMTYLYFVAIQILALSHAVCRDEGGDKKLTVFKLKF